MLFAPQMSKYRSMSKWLPNFWSHYRCRSRNRLVARLRPDQRPNAAQAYLNRWLDRAGFQQAIE
jgi:hypothetical protein